MPRITIDGSSTAYGLWGGPQGGWADRVKRAHMPDALGADGKRPLWTVHNLAVSFRTIEEICHELPEFMYRYSRGDKALVGVAMVGQVESRFPGGGVEQAVPPQRFSKALHTLASATMGETSSLVLVGATPIFPSRIESFGRFHDTYDLDERMAYDAIVRAVATERGIPYVSVMSPLLTMERAGERVMDDDGLHPNAQGHTVIYNLAHPVIEREVERLRV